MWHASLARVLEQKRRTAKVSEWGRADRRDARDLAVRLLHCGEGPIDREIGDLAVHYRKRMTDFEKRIINYDRHLAGRK